MILVVVDRFTKYARFLPCTTTIDSMELAQLLFDQIFRIFGLPSSIVSDHGPVFISNTWYQITKLLGISRNLTSGYHPESDGQTERTNQTLEQFLRVSLNHLQTNWHALLGIAELAYNSATHSSHGLAPFEALFGHHTSPVLAWLDELAKSDSSALLLLP